MNKLQILIVILSFTLITACGDGEGDSAALRELPDAGENQPNIETGNGGSGNGTEILLPPVVNPTGPVTTPTTPPTNGNNGGTAPDSDRDGDGIADTADNCPDVSNPDQDDNDQNGAGNACDPTVSNPPPAPLEVQWTPSPIKVEPQKTELVNNLKKGTGYTYLISRKLDGSVYAWVKTDTEWAQGQRTLPINCKSEPSVIYNAAHGGMELYCVGGDQNKLQRLISTEQGVWRDNSVEELGTVSLNPDTRVVAITPIHGPGWVEVFAQNKDGYLVVYAPDANKEIIVGVIPFTGQMAAVADPYCGNCFKVFAKNKDDQVIEYSSDEHWGDTIDRLTPATIQHRTGNQHVISEEGIQGSPVAVSDNQGGFIWIFALDPRRPQEGLHKLMGWKQQCYAGEAADSEYEAIEPIDTGSVEYLLKPDTLTAYVNPISGNIEVYGSSRARKLAYYRYSLRTHSWNFGDTSDGYYGYYDHGRYMGRRAMADTTIPGISFDPTTGNTVLLTRAGTSTTDLYRAFTWTGGSGQWGTDEQYFSPGSDEEMYLRYRYLDVASVGIGTYDTSELPSGSPTLVFMGYAPMWEPHGRRALGQ